MQSEHDDGMDNGRNDETANRRRRRNKTVSKKKCINGNNDVEYSVGNREIVSEILFLQFEENGQKQTEK